MAVIDTIREGLTKFVENGSNVNDLTTHDPLYQYIKNSDIYWQDGSAYTMDEKFALAGFPRAEKIILSFEDKIKQILSEYVQNGGDVNNLKSTDSIYNRIKGIKAYKEDGTLYTVDEKFELAGFPRKPKDRQSKIEALKAEIKKCLDNGTSISDEMLKRVKNITILTPDGVPCSFGAKCRMFGIPYQDKNTKITEEWLKTEITKYLNLGYSLYNNIKLAPWYESLQNYIKTTYKNTGIKYTTEEVLKRLGFNYSPTYQRFINLLDVVKYADENGFVDSFRKSESLKHYVKDCGITLDMPIGYVVELVTNCKLKKHFINGDYIEQTRKEVLEYLQEHKTLDGIKRRNSSLYNKLRHIQIYATTGTNEQLEMTEVLSFLGITPAVWNATYNAKEATTKNNSPERALSKVIERAKKSGAAYNNGRIVITPDNFEPDEYSVIKFAATREGMFITDYLNSRGVNYVGGVNVNRFSAYKVDKLPGIDKMKAERDKIYNSTIHDKLTKEQNFEVWISACVLAYNRYKQHDDPMELGQEG